MIFKILKNDFSHYFRGEVCKIFDLDFRYPFSAKLRCRKVINISYVCMDLKALAYSEILNIGNKYCAENYGPSRELCGFALSEATAERSFVGMNVSLGLSVLTSPFRILIKLI